MQTNMIKTDEKMGSKIKNKMAEDVNHKNNIEMNCAEASEIARYVDFEDFIGVFDSGMGGISTLIELINAFPNERFVYFGDNKNAPYGEKSEEEIYHLSDEIVKSFVEAGAKAIVIACNTATSSSLEKLKQRYAIPIIGIEPELEQAVIENAGKNILVMATNATLSGKLYQKKLEYYSQKKGKHKPKSIFSVPMPKLVEIVEEAKMSKADVARAMQEIDTNILKSISAIVLGCTHFVLLKNLIEDVMNDLFVDVTLYEANAKIIHSIQNQLQKNLNHEQISKKKEEEISSKKLILLSSDETKLCKMVDIFNECSMIPKRDSIDDLIKSKKFTKRDLELLLNYVEEFLEEKKLDDLDRELVRNKYIKCNKTNVKMTARAYKKPLKYVSDRVTWLDNELFKFLSKKM